MQLQNKSGEAMVWSQCIKRTSVRSSNLADGWSVPLNASQPIKCVNDYEILVYKELLVMDLCRCPPWISWLWSAHSCTAWPAIPTPPLNNQEVGITPPTSHTHRLPHIDIQWTCRAGAKWVWAACSILNSRYVKNKKAKTLKMCSSKWVRSPFGSILPDIIAGFTKIINVNFYFSMLNFAFIFTFAHAICVYVCTYACVFNLCGCIHRILTSIICPRLGLSI